MNLVQWGIQSAILLALGAIAYFLKDMKQSIDEKITENKNDIKALNKLIDEKVTENKSEISSLKKEFNEFKERVPEKYVMKEEFVRTMTAVDKRFDIVNEKLDKIYITMVSVGTNNERK